MFYSKYKAKKTEIDGITFDKNINTIYSYNITNIKYGKNNIYPNKCT